MGLLRNVLPVGLKISHAPVTHTHTRTQGGKIRHMRKTIQSELWRKRHPTWNAELTAMQPSLGRLGNTHDNYARESDTMVRVLSPIITRKRRLTHTRSTQQLLFLGHRITQVATSHCSLCFCKNPEQINSRWCPLGGRWVNQAGTP